MFAVVEFGSIARGTNDYYSDRDLLLVCERSGYSILKPWYEAQGYSVSTLSPKQLKLMQIKGALFIQHLKCESSILFDYQSNFELWLSDCNFIPPSADEINRCLDSIEFLYQWPYDSRLIGWQADVVYTLFRDFCIKYFARQSKLVFGIEDIKTALKTSNLFKGMDMSLLDKVREAKMLYRNRMRLPQDIENAFLEWFRDLAFRLKLQRKLTAEDCTELKVITLAKSKFNSHYERLRTLEALYIIALSKKLYHPSHIFLTKLITSPNAYGSAQVKKQQVIEKYLSELISMLSELNS